MKKILDKINQKINHARHSNIFLYTSDNSEPVFILKFNSSIRSNSNISMLYRSLLERFLIFLIFQSL